VVELFLEDTIMATFCRTYTDEADAREAVRDLLASGAPPQAVRLLTGSRPHDIRAERVGAFAGSLAPDAPVGTFGNVRRRRRQGRGAFAGDPDGQRQGSFADVERDVIVSFDGGAPHPHIATHRALRRLLAAVTLDGEPADRLVEELHHGRGLVVADAEVSGRRR
jgi:hypothetical protein